MQSSFAWSVSALGNHRLRRKLLQLTSALIYNINIGGFIKGKLYTGKLKGVCVPGLNCYSCPGAVGACPLGSLQASLSAQNYGMLRYVLGIMLLFGILFGRLICAFLCPFGLLQEVIYKIPSRKLKKSAVTRALSHLKYIVLTIFVVALPVLLNIKNGVGEPAFCKYICPAGTFEAGIPLLAADSALRASAGGLFALKITILAAILIASVFIYRVFCRFLCPLGAFYSLFNHCAFFGIKIDAGKCTGCKACVRACRMDVKHINDRECIRCGDCAPACRYGAIDMRLIHFPLKKENKKTGA